MTDDLATWLLERIAEDERLARAAVPGPWRHNPNKHWRKPGTAWFEEAVFAGPAGKDARCVAGTGESDDPQSMADADHIAAWDPARVLAECDAKRRIVARHQPVEWWWDTPPGDPRGPRILSSVDCSTCVKDWGSDDPNDQSCHHAALAWPCPEIRDTASIYADRPGYRVEWRP